MKLIRRILSSIYLVPVTICSLACSSFAYAEAECEIDGYSLLGYFVYPNRTCGDVITGQDVFSLVKIVDQYWDGRIPSEKRFSLHTKEYQDSLKKIFGWKDGSEFFIPVDEYERSLHGYQIEKIQTFGETDLDITMNIKWSQEGYQGKSTFIFNMVEENNIWKIRLIVWP